jgi:GntR family transcriptional repressor for pyruvate dehydrogenase complex
MHNGHSSESLSRVDQIVAALQVQLTNGAIGVGELLPSERSLCVSFGVGRTTIREALATLVEQGYLVRTPRGARALDPRAVRESPASLGAVAALASARDLYEVRKLLEVRIAHWAALRATPAELEQMRTIVEADDPAAGSTRNTRAGLHDALAAATHNPVLLQLYQSNRTLLFRLPFFWDLLDKDQIRATRAARHELAQRWHQQILAAVQDRDSDEAAGAMFQHLDVMEKDLLAQLRRRGVPDHVLLDGRRPRL